MLPAVLAFNASAVEASYSELAGELPGDIPRSGEGLVSWFEQLIRGSGLPATLQAAGVPAGDLPRLAADAMLQQRLLVNNPVDVDEATALSLYEQAWAG